MRTAVFTDMAPSWANVVTTVAVPFIRVAYAVLLPSVGVAMIAKIGYEA